MINLKYKVLVDPQDKFLLTETGWHVHNGYVEKTVYAGRINGKKTNKTISLHRRIMGCKQGDGLIIDHINGNPLDNRRANLRLVTRSQNRLNTTIVTSKTSRFKGVTRAHKRKGWQVKCAGKYLGYFLVEEQAAKAYNDYASATFGEYARMNQA